MNVTEIGTKESRIHRKNDGSCQRDSAEHKGYDRALTEKRITENNITDASSEAILDGNYRPSPVRRVEIPKDNGKKRQLAYQQQLIESFSKLSCKCYHHSMMKRLARRAMASAQSEAPMMPSGNS